jgi:hypothetical protein
MSILFIRDIGILFSLIVKVLHMQNLPVTYNIPLYSFITSRLLGLCVPSTLLFPGPYSYLRTFVLSIAISFITPLPLIAM